MSPSYNYIYIYIYIYNVRIYVCMGIYNIYTAIASVPSALQNEYVSSHVSSTSTHIICIRNTQFDPVLYLYRCTIEKKIERKILYTFYRKCL